MYCPYTGQFCRGVWCSICESYHKRLNQASSVKAALSAPIASDAIALPASFFHLSHPQFVLKVQAGHLLPPPAEAFPIQASAHHFHAAGCFFIPIPKDTPACCVISFSSHAGLPASSYSGRIFLHGAEAVLLNIPRFLSPGFRESFSNELLRGSFSAVLGGLSPALPPIHEGLGVGE